MEKSIQNTEAPRQEAQPTGNKGKPRATSGERLFNFTSWFGLGWIANAAVSVVSADAAKHTWLKRPYMQTANWTANLLRGDKKFSYEELSDSRKLMSHFSVENSKEVTQNGMGEFLKSLKEPEDSLLNGLKNKNLLKGESLEAMRSEFTTLREAGMAFHNRETIASFAVLNIGGWLMMAPIKWMEDHKAWWVEKFDQMLGSDKTTGKKRQEIDARHDYLRVQPRQTWASVLTSRAITQPLIIGLYAITSKKNNILTKLGIKDYEGMDKYADNFTEWASKKTTKTMEANAEALGQSSLKTAKKFEGLLEKEIKITPKAEEAAKSAKKISLYSEIAEPATQQKNLSATDKTEQLKSSGRHRYKQLWGLGFIEVTYSLILAAGTFAWSRVLGPILASRAEPLGAKQAKNEQLENTPNDTATTPSEKSEAIEAKIEAPANPSKYTVSIVFNQDYQGNIDPEKQHEGIEKQP